MTLLVPPMSALMAFIFLGERLSLLGIGIIITVSGIALVILKREEKPTSKYKVDSTGIIYALIGAAGQAVGLIFAKNAFNEGEMSGFLASFVRISFLQCWIIYPLALLTKTAEKTIQIYMNDNEL